MSSHPPKYDTSTEEEEGLLSDDIIYPPAAPSFSQAPASEVAGGSTGEHTIVFRFMPRYPLTLVCEPSNCLARLPSSRQQSVDIGREAFAALREIDEDRIQFFVIHKAPADTGMSHVYAEITSSAWPGLSSAPPDHIAIGVRDMPGDLQKRQRHESFNNIRAFVTAVLVGVGFFVGPWLLLTWLFSGSSSSSSSSKGAHHSTSGSSLSFAPSATGSGRA